MSRYCVWSLSDNFNFPAKRLIQVLPGGGAVGLHCDSEYPRADFSLALFIHLAIAIEKNESVAWQQVQVLQFQPRFPAGCCVVSSGNLRAHRLPFVGSPAPTSSSVGSHAPLGEVETGKPFLEAGTPCCGSLVSSSPLTGQLHLKPE